MESTDLKFWRDVCNASTEVVKALKEGTTPNEESLSFLHKVSNRAKKNPFVCPLVDIAFEAEHLMRLDKSLHEEYKKKFYDPAKSASNIESLYDRYISTFKTFISQNIEEIVSSPVGLYTCRDIYIMYISLLNMTGVAPEGVVEIAKKAYMGLKFDYNHMNDLFFKSPYTLQNCDHSDVAGHLGITNIKCVNIKNFQMEEGWYQFAMPNKFFSACGMLFDCIYNYSKQGYPDEVEILSISDTDFRVSSHKGNNTLSTTDYSIQDLKKGSKDRTITALYNIILLSNKIGLTPDRISITDKSGNIQVFMS